MHKMCVVSTKYNHFSAQWSRMSAPCVVNRGSFLGWVTPQREKQVVVASDFAIIVNRKHNEVSICVLDGCHSMVSQCETHATCSLHWDMTCYVKSDIKLI